MKVHNIQTFIGTKSRIHTYNLDIVPDRIVCKNARKRRWPKCTKQIDLRMLAVHERIENPELYKKFHKPILKGKTMTMVTRKINGQSKIITPLQNFDHSVGRRLDALKYQFKLLGKCIGPQFESTQERLDFVELAITEMFDATIKSLRNPSKEQAVKNEFAAKLSAC